MVLWLKFLFLAITYLFLDNDTRTHLYALCQNKKVNIELIQKLIEP